MILIKTDLHKYTANLRRAHRSAYPLTVRSTLDRFAFLTKMASIKSVIPSRFTIRKKSFTRLTIGFQRSPNTFDIDRMVSKAGQWAKTKGRASFQYEKQEMGGIEKPRGRYLKTATKHVRGGSYGKSVRERFYLSNIKVKKPRQFVSNIAKDSFKRGQQAIAVAIRTKMKDPFIGSGIKKVKGIYIASGKKTKLLYRFDKKSRRVGIKSWLRVATGKIMEQKDKIYVKEARRRMEKELKRGLKS